MRFAVSILFPALIAAAIFSVEPPSARAEADLMVYPTRVILGDRSRTAQVEVINTAPSQGLYKISLVRKRMTDIGEFVEVATPDREEKFADDLVKYSPRQVTLLPGGSQTIRMILKVPPGLPEGEYRSHLLFTKMPSGVSNLPAKGEQEPQALSMRLDVNIGVSIPVIVRHGTLHAAATIDPASVQVISVEPKQQLVSFTLTRTGTRSIYGDVAVYRGGEKVVEGKGFAVYLPNKLRKVGLHIPDQFRLGSGDRLKVVFTERDATKPLAEAAAVVP